MDWEEAAELAVEWTDDRCREEDATGLLYVEAHAGDYTDGPLGWFAGQHTIATRHSRPTGGGKGPVLAYCPNPGWFGDAVRAAHGSALCVIEGLATPMRGWAMETGATNLLTGEATPDTRTDEQRDLHERLAFKGNNAWGDSYAQGSTPRILSQLRDSGLPLEVTIGVMLALGASERGIKSLRKYANRA